MENRGRSKNGFPNNTILHSANSYLRVHKTNDVMRRGNFHLFARVARDIDPNNVRRRVSWFRKLYCTLVRC